jgi:transposase
MTWNNGMVEGFVNKIKAIKRSSYGQAGFPLLQRRVLLHPASRKKETASISEPKCV